MRSPYAKSGVKTVTDIKIEMPPGEVARPAATWENDSREMPPTSKIDLKIIKRVWVIFDMRTVAGVVPASPTTKRTLTSRTHTQTAYVESEKQYNAGDAAVERGRAGT